MSKSAPIPPPKDDDAEDVFWALSTAATLCSRGERSEALRWLRRAAEKASDQGADARALELMKAAAELAATLPAASPARPSTPPPLPKRAAPEAPAAPPRAPPLAASAPPSRPLPAPPAAPRAPSAPAASRPAARPARERHGTLTGRRIPARRTSSPDLGKVARPPGVPAEIPDIPVDDLDEETNVYEGKGKSAKNRRPNAPVAPAKPVVTPHVDAVALKPKALSTAPIPKPSAGLGAPMSKASTKLEPQPSPPAPKADAAPKTSPAAQEVSPKMPVKAPAPAQATTERVSAPKAAPPAGDLPAPSKSETIARTPTLRKGTMQLVDEGFESMLDAPEPTSIAVPIFVELPVPPEEARAMAAEPRGTRGLLAQRVAIVAEPGGGARLITMDDATSVPQGAIAAIVVPLSPADGEPLARLLGATKA